MDTDITIIGAGVIGLAIAQKISEKCDNVAVIEKNSSFGMETSSRNSEVIHAGIYYPKNFLKTELCIQGNIEMYNLCSKNNIPHRRIGKIIFSNERESLEKLLAQGKSNGVVIETLSQSQLQKMEPNLKAKYGLFSPNTGIVDTHALMKHYVKKAESQGTNIVYNTEVRGIDLHREWYTVHTVQHEKRDSFTTKVLINCAGLYAHKVAQMVGISIEDEGYKQHYVKGEYYGVVPAKNNIVTHLVYPTPELQGLGIHTVTDMNGRLKFGPNAYSVDTIDYRMDETHKQEFVQAIQSYLPQITPEDIYPDMSGIRPKIYGTGKADFIIRNEADKGLNGFINLLGMESPGITASPAIGTYVMRIVQEMYKK